MKTLPNAPEDCDGNDPLLFERSLPPAAALLNPGHLRIKNRWEEFPTRRSASRPSQLFEIRFQISLNTARPKEITNRHHVRYEIVGKGEEGR